MSSGRQGIATIRLHPWHRVLVYLVLFIIAATGLFWTVLEDVLMQGPGPLPALLLKTHGICSAVALMVFGSLLPTHMRLAWRHRRNVSTGLLITLSMAVVSVTATALYYGSEEWRDLTRWTHILVGAGMVLVLPLHVLVGRWRSQREGHRGLV